MFVIRKATRADVPTICAMRSRAILANCAGFYPVQSLTKWAQQIISDVLIQDIAEKFYVSEDNDKVVGSGALNFATGTIDAIFVDPDYFGRGLAKAMMNFLEQLARQADLKVLRLDARLNAAGFYRSWGFDRALG